MTIYSFCRSIRLIAIVATFGMAFAVPSAGAKGLTGLQTNEDYVKRLGANATLNVAQPLDVFRSIFAGLPQRVTVYPTENYYYFSFYRAGVRYAGNIRLAIDGLAKREAYFTYFRSATLQHPDGDGERLILNAASGVQIDQVSELSWKLSAFGRSVIFDLNDLRKVRPPANVMRDQETFIGPVFDESGLRFFLLFDKAKAKFLYVLDETVTVPEEFSPSQADATFQLGRRTGFVFAVEEERGARKVLVGVFAANVELNNYFDGPFDQLPDNFIKDDRLQDALILRQPDLKGQIDRYGNFSGGERRVVIAPYATYESPDDLKAMAACRKQSGLPITDDCLLSQTGNARNN